MRAEMCYLAYGLFEIPLLALWNGTIWHTAPTDSPANAIRQLSSTTNSTKCATDSPKPIYPQTNIWVIVPTRKIKSCIEDEGYLSSLFPQTRILREKSGLHFGDVSLKIESEDEIRKVSTVTYPLHMRTQYLI